MHRAPLLVHVFPLGRTSCANTSDNPTITKRLLHKYSSRIITCKSLQWKVYWWYVLHVAQIRHYMTDHINVTNTFTSSKAWRVSASVEFFPAIMPYPALFTTTSIRSNCYGSVLSDAADNFHLIGKICLQGKNCDALRPVSKLLALREVAATCWPTLYLFHRA